MEVEVCKVFPLILKYFNFWRQCYLPLLLLAFSAGLVKFYCPALIHLNDHWFAIYRLPDSMWMQHKQKKIHYIMIYTASTINNHIHCGDFIHAAHSWNETRVAGLTSFQVLLKPIWRCEVNRMFRRRLSFIVFTKWTEYTVESGLKELKKKHTFLIILSDWGVPPAFRNESRTSPRTIFSGWNMYSQGTLMVHSGSLILKRKVQFFNSLNNTNTITYPPLNWNKWTNKRTTFA